MRIFSSSAAGRIVAVSRQSGQGLVPFCHRFAAAGWAGASAARAGMVAPAASAAPIDPANVRRFMASVIGKAPVAIGLRIIAEGNIVSGRHCEPPPPCGSLKAALLRVHPVPRRIAVGVTAMAALRPECGHGGQRRGRRSRRAAAGDGAAHVPTSMWGIAAPGCEEEESGRWRGFLIGMVNHHALPTAVRRQLLVAFIKTPCVEARQPSDLTHHLRRPRIDEPHRPLSLRASRAHCAARYILLSEINSAVVDLEITRDHCGPCEVRPAHIPFLLLKLVGS